MLAARVAGEEKILEEAKSLRYLCLGGSFTCRNVPMSLMDIQWFRSKTFSEEIFSLLKI